MAERILVVDDDAQFQGLLVDALTEAGFEVETAPMAVQGIEKVRTGKFDVVLQDIKMPGMTGLEALPELLKADPEVDVIVMTGYASKDSGVQAMQNGAYDYFTKPFSIREMEVVIRRALERRRLKEEVESLRRSVGRKVSPLDRIIGTSDAINLAKTRIERVAGLDADVLVMGETGTGKELVSDTIHQLSQRAKKPFIKINCAAIPENLLESELFGHEKGAFTGALEAKPGKFELADGGTLLLDEIGDMPLHLQPKLLRAVEQKTVERVGGSKPISFDVRIIAATNQEMEKHVQEGKFRSDLYYRLNVASITLPPLRERREDVPALAEHFLENANLKLGTRVDRFAKETLREMFEYDWPGNVRQLAHAVERAAIFCASERIRPEDMNLTQSEGPVNSMQLIDLPEEGTSLRDAITNFERTLIVTALRRTGGVQTEAADLLRITPKNLWNKIKKHEIDPSAPA